MNDIFEIIKSRRSVRKFIDKPISKETIDKLIEAGKWAPTGMNNQPWGFIVVQEKALIKEISDRAIPYIKKIVEEDPKFIRYKKRMSVKDFNIFYDAPCVIIVLGKKDGFSYENDCSMAAQNIMLTAWSMGIGSCWVGMMKPLEKDEWFINKFQIPDTYTIVAPLALGYFDPNDVRLVERKPVEIIKWS